MRFRTRLLLLAGGAIAIAAGLHAFQREFRVYTSLEPYDDVALPENWKVPADWVFGRLMYPPHPHARFSRPFGYGGSIDWRNGGTSWAQDYPRADRHFSKALLRLTRINARTVEQPINLDDGDDVYNWPWMCAGEMGDWKLTSAQAARLRDYLLRGGFLMLDDFWGTEEWNRFEESIKVVFPDRPVVEIDNADPIFHAVYDLDDRYQIPGQWALMRGTTYRNDGFVARWRGVYDDNGRLMIAMCFNSDVGDSWEWADDPRYQEKYSALGIRIGINYVIYSLTH